MNRSEFMRTLDLFDHNAVSGKDQLALVEYNRILAEFDRMISRIAELEAENAKFEASLKWVAWSSWWKINIR